jgi:hypothetical protein
MPSSSEVSTDPRAVILVEGASDRRAVEVLARRRGRHLAAERVTVVAMGGITNLGHHLDRLGPGVTVTGLYDRDEEAWVRRVLARRATPVSLHACDLDLEDELIRALGVPAVLDVVGARGDSAAWAALRRQPFHRDHPEHQVLHRFLGTTSGRKIEYAGLLTDAAYDLDRVPEPLDAVLTDTSS